MAPANRSEADRAAGSDSVAPVTTLAERLGHSPDARLVIINADDLGLCQAANSGVYESVRQGLATSATIMVPCPWARAAAADYSGEDIGVHLTLNAEHEQFRWGPITHAPSLLDGDGGFPRTVADLWDHADLDEVRRECRAQIERAILWGFDISHLDSHMGALQLRPEFFDVYLDLAVEFGLPIRLSGASTQKAIGFPFRELATEEGVIITDHFVHVGGVGSRRAIEAALFDLPAGVTELYVHPATDTPELRALDDDWASRVDDLHLMCHDSRLRAMVERSGAMLIGYRELRALQRIGA